MSRDVLAALIAERFGPPPLRDPARTAPVDDELTKARRRRALNDALDDAPPDYRRGVRPVKEAR